jgi:hypothetical protein
LHALTTSETGAAGAELFAETVHKLNMHRKTPSKSDIWTSELATELKI